MSAHARRAHTEWYHQVIAEYNKQAGPKRSAKILEVVLETLELEDKIRTKNALDNELASRRPGHLVSSLTQLRTKHLTINDSSLSSVH